MPVGGLGAMGSAIAERLLAQGHRLTVWNRTAGRGIGYARRHPGATPPITLRTQLRPTGGAHKKLARCMSPLMAVRPEGANHQ